MQTFIAGARHLAPFDTMPTREGRTAAGRRPRRRRNSVSIGLRIAKSPQFIGLSAGLVASYLRFVNATCRIAYEPAPPDQILSPQAPSIIVMWHGQNFMMPFIRPKDLRVNVLASRYVDGEVIARTLHRLGCGTVRGSGSIDAATAPIKGGVSAFLAMRRLIEAGTSIGITADFGSKRARHAGRGVVMLAKVTGRPIIPAAFTTSRRVELNTWDKAIINLPFGRAACVFGESILVPSSADDALIEQKRGEVEETLNAATTRAREIVDSRPA